jgi:enamine deaminase RidA (YjgF/YER057c/UK114 family)
MLKHITFVAHRFPLYYRCRRSRKSLRSGVSLYCRTKLRLPLADAVLVGKPLISGRGGVDLSTMKVPADLKDEVKLMMDDYKSILAMAGMTMDDLVSVTIYCPDLNLYAAFNEIYRTYFTKGFPARAFIGSGQLLFGMRFEMQAIAIKR